MNLQKWSLLFLVFLLLSTILMAQEIKGEMYAKGEDYFGIYSYSGVRGQTYSVELWVAPEGSDDFVLIENVEGNWGPGLPVSHEENFSFNPALLPEGLSGDLSFKFKLIPEIPEIWSADSSLSVEIQGLEGDWFNDNLTNSSYYTFGITSVSEVSGKIALNFTMTNTHRGSIDLVWDRDRAVMLRIIKTNGAEDITYTGNLWFEGISRGSYGSYTFDPGKTIEGYILVPMGFHLVDHITMGTFNLRIPNRSYSDTIRFGLIK